MNVVYVDKNDTIIGEGTTNDAYDNGVIVRISRVILCNGKGELLLQKRAAHMRNLPGKWDQTAGGHVDVGETYDVAAARELSEEMGISGVPLRPVAKFYTEEKDEAKTKKRFNMIFTGLYDGEVAIDNDEVGGYKWMLPEELERQMQQTPTDFTEGFIKTFKAYLANQ